jgi:signal transduction histidine kinase
MNQHYTYTPDIWPAALTALFLLLLAGYGWRRRHVPGAIPFALSCVFTACWAVGLAMQAIAVDAATQRLWMRLGSIWSLPAVTAVTCFILEYVWPGRWLTRRNLVLLSIAPLLFAVLMLSNERHWFMVRDIAGAARIPFGPAGWIFVGYSLVLGIINVAALVWLFAHSPRHRWPAALMIAVQIASRALFMQQGITADPLQLPFNAPVFALPYMVYAIALFAFRIFDPLVMAHRTAVEQLDVGIMTLDGAQCLIDMNPAAERILGLPLEHVEGCPISSLLPAHVGQRLGSGAASGADMSLGAPPEIREYTLEASPLRDWRGLSVGTLLLIHDVTEQRRAQAQIMAQQRALATLQERERLARELHDGAGQMFGYVSLQAQAIHKLVGNGQLTAAEEQLARLADVASAAHTDLRESILSLKAGAGASSGFLAALRQYAAAYQSNYGITVELSVAGGLSDDDFAPDTTAHLLRVITEALTNARRHGGAGRVTVSLAREGDVARVTVADDGCGFDATQNGNSTGGHFGLAFMRERMAQVGGCLAIDSRPGVGTCVTLDVPLRAEGKVPVS